ncbi:MAG: DUF3300 domain-containing protein [Acidobacteriaceae bacterium]
MKSITKQPASPVASFLQGFNGAPPLPQSRWSGIDIAAQRARKIFALILAVSIIPMGQGAMLFAQSAPPPPQGQYAPPPPNQPGQPPDQTAPQGQGDLQNQGEQEDQGDLPPDQGAPQGEPLTPEELGQLVAPIALYPDALVAQILAASTYPSEVVQADQWIQTQGNIPEAQLAAGANAQDWDPSVKALVAFPSVLAQMDKNIQWTTDLGNAYYNQPNDVMSAVQTMRGRAQSAGTLRDTPQQQVSEDDGNIVIAPADPTVVYVPVYNPWDVYGAPIGVYPGYYYGPPAGVYFGSGIGFGVGIGIGMFTGWGWGWPHWGFNWRNRAVLYRGGHYYTRSRTVYNRGWNRPGGPPRGYSGRGAYNRGGNFNRGSGGFNRGAQQNRRVEQNRSSGGFNRGVQQNRGTQQNRRVDQNRSSGGFNRGVQQNRSVQQNRGSGGARPSGGARRSGGGPGGGHGGGGQGR